MRHGHKLAGCALTAMLLALGLPSGAKAQTSPDLTSKLLIEILVKKGVLSRSDANSILQEAQAAASAAQTQTATAAPVPSAAPVSSVSVTSTRTADGTIHVTYVPQVVQDQIAKVVTNHIQAQQMEEGYSGNSLVPDWVNKLHFSGDLRLRYEDDLFPHGNDDSAGGDFTNFNGINTGAPFDILKSNGEYPPEPNVDQNRNRFRLRARLGVLADLGDDFTMGFRIATGENDSPVSENQTLGNAPGGAQGGDFSKYAIWLDRAYLAWAPHLADKLNLTVEGGRFDNPFFSTNLIWADDLGFDGAAVMASYQLNDGFTPFFNGGAFPVYNTDFSFASNQPAKFPSHNKWLFGFQGGTSWQFADDSALKVGIADYAFVNVAGKLSAPCTVLSTADQCSTDDDRPSFAQNGNTYMALRDIIPTYNSSNQLNPQYQYFGLASNFNELALTEQLDLGNFDPTHIWLDGEYVRNLAFSKTDIANKAVNNRSAVSDPNNVGAFVGGPNGYYIYVNVGDKELKQRWDWNAMLGYKYIESDAVVDAFNDSDFGLGGTNLKGYILGANLALSKQVWLRARYLSADSIVGPPYKADVFQFDLNSKF